MKIAQITGLKFGARPEDVFDVIITNIQGSHVVAETPLRDARGNIVATNLEGYRGAIQCDFKIKGLNHLSKRSLIGAQVRFADPEYEGLFIITTNTKTRQQDQWMNGSLTALWYPVLQPPAGFLAWLSGPGTEANPTLARDLVNTITPEYYIDANIKEFDGVGDHLRLSTYSKTGVTSGKITVRVKIDPSNNTYPVLMSLGDVVGGGTNGVGIFSIWSSDALTFRTRGAGGINSKNIAFSTIDPRGEFFTISLEWNATAGTMKGTVGDYSEEWTGIASNLFPTTLADLGVGEEKNSAVTNLAGQYNHAKLEVNGATELEYRFAEGHEEIELDVSGNGNHAAYTTTAGITSIAVQDITGEATPWNLQNGFSAALISDDDDYIDTGIIADADTDVEVTMRFIQNDVNFQMGTLSTATARFIIGQHASGGFFFSWGDFSADSTGLGGTGVGEADTEWHTHKIVGGDGYYRDGVLEYDLSSATFDPLSHTLYLLARNSIGNPTLGSETETARVRIWQSGRLVRDYRAQSDGTFLEFVNQTTATNEGTGAFELHYTPALSDGLGLDVLGNPLTNRVADVHNDSEVCVIFPHEYGFPEFNPDTAFDNGTTYWSVVGESSISGGVARIYSSAGANTYIIQQDLITVGGHYVLEHEVTAKVAGDITVDTIGGIVHPYVGVHKTGFVALQDYINFKRVGVTDVTIDNVHVHRAYSYDDILAFTDPYRVVVNGNLINAIRPLYKIIGANYKRFDGVGDQLTVPGLAVTDVVTMADWEYGPEVIGNGGFDSPASEWVTSGESTVTDGVGRIYSSAGAGSDIHQNGVLTVGKVYVCSYDVLDATAGNLLGVTTFGITILPKVVGTNSFVFTAANAAVYFARAGGATDITIDNLSIREITNFAALNSAIPTVSADTIDFTEGTVANLEINGVLVYPCSEGPSATLYSASLNWPHAEITSTSGLNAMSLRDGSGAVLPRNHIEGFTQVATFNGTTDRIDYDTITPRTLIFICKPDNNSTAMYLTRNISPVQIFGIRGTGYFTVYDAGWYVTTADAIPDEWQTVIYRHNGTDYDVYLNGVHEGTAGKQYLIPVNRVGDNTVSWEGNMAFYAAYDRALTTDEVTGFDPDNPPINPELLWRFDSVIETSLITDHSGNGRDGILNAADVDSFWAVKVPARRNRLGKSALGYDLTRPGSYLHNGFEGGILGPTTMTAWPDVILNGGFLDGVTNWQVSGNFAVVSGSKGQFIATGGASAGITQANALVVGNLYLVKLTTFTATGSLTLDSSFDNTPVIDYVGEVVFVARATSTGFTIETSATETNMVIDDIAAYPLFGYSQMLADAIAEPAADEWRFSYDRNENIIEAAYYNPALTGEQLEALDIFLTGRH